MGGDGGQGWWAWPLGRVCGHLPLVRVGGHGWWAWLVGVASGRGRWSGPVEALEVRYSEAESPFCTMHFFKFFSILILFFIIMPISYFAFKMKLPKW